MIKVNKDLNNIPKSLIPAILGLFPGCSKIPTTSSTTHARRMELIDSCRYIHHGNYNRRYKLNDIRDRLRTIYNGKCAFCEQKVEQLHVEHFRPKDIYYWLAYSWDNLILACPVCNQSKRANFEIDGVKAILINDDNTIRNINSLSGVYDKSENPKMVNPEVIDPKDYITFSKSGKINSTDAKFKHTIISCELNRTSLNDERRKLLDTFKNEIDAELLESNNKEAQVIAFKTLFRSFIRASKDPSNSYIAFRNYAIENGWLKEKALI